MDYAISLNGVMAAQRTIDQSARRVATPQATTDYADEAVKIKQSELSAKANYRMISAEMDLDHTLLNLFA
jgi:hypothetical protein